MNSKKQYAYLAIDMKSFYASVECVDRGLDPLTTNLVVADKSRTDKTICLAVSPALKAYGIGGRPRLFEVVQKIHEINYERKQNNNWKLTGKSCHATDLAIHPDWEVDYIVATPRMAHYIEVSTKVYQTYLKYVAPEDIHVYSIDEVFIDVTSYLWSYKITAHELAMKMIRDVLKTTGITATAGVGTNLYLAKIAMDIVAKHQEADRDGVRIAELDEMSYRRLLWNYKPLTKFWRVGNGIAARLAPYGIDTMGKIARTSIANEELLYQLFGVNAELLIDHAWGWEPCTMDLVKAYKPETNSFSCGQVLNCAYSFEKAEVVVKEMADSIALDLVDKHMVTDQLILTVGYDVESLANADVRVKYQGEVRRDYYGRLVPKHAHGTTNLKQKTSSAAIITKAIVNLYHKIVNPHLLIHRINITTSHVVNEDMRDRNLHILELDLFTDYGEMWEQKKREEEILNKERKIQNARLAIKQRYGKNAILKGLNFEEGATGMERNLQIGGHKA
uniref:Y-family DNA polymerase n=1 Tax=Prevotella sp. GTC17260 TaxID=3236796 RepID=A0AB33J7R5_9BACT